MREEVGKRGEGKRWRRRWVREGKQVEQRNENHTCTDIMMDIVYKKVCGYLDRVA